MRGRILVVDDEPLKRITLKIELSEAGFEVDEAADAIAAKQILDSHPIDVVVSDVRMPGMDGLDLLAHVKAARPETAFILMTAYATVSTAVQAIKRGAYDYVTKPFTTQDLLAKLDRVFAAQPPRASTDAPARFGPLLGRSPAMRRLFEQVATVVDHDRPVLIRGESGTGKGLLAEAIHRQGRRAAGPFVAVVCSGLPPAAIAGELFGADRTVRGRAARYEQAEGGSLLLEELDALPADAQAHLQRVLEQEAPPSDGAASGVRIIATSAADLLQLVQDGRLREDLYYRLNALSVTVSPLRERREDIPLLAQHFCEKHAALANGRRLRLHAHALDELMTYAWPGNVRELEHVVERALAFCHGDEIRTEHVLPLAREASAAAPELELTEVGQLGLTETVADIEKRIILMALRQCKGNQARAAQRLGIPRTTLRDKMAKYAIPVG